MPRKIGDVVLEVEDLHTYIFTRWGVVKAVDGVSFSLRQGETLGIVGESGCGKTMTALSLLRLVPRPAARIVKGAIRLEGEDLMDMSEREMREHPRPPHLDDPAGPADLAQPGLHDRQPARRGDQDPPPRRAPLARAPGHRRPQAGAPGRARAAGAGLSPPDERRHEAARGRRHRDLVRAAGDHRRRADDVARRDHPGAVPAPAQRDPGGDQPRADLHHPRLRHRGQDVRSRDGDVRGPASWRAARCATSSTTRRIPTPRRCSTRCRAWTRTSTGSTRSTASRRRCGTCPRAAGSPRAARTPTTAAGRSTRPRSPSARTIRAAAGCSKRHGSRA